MLLKSWHLLCIRMEKSAKATGGCSRTTVPGTGSGCTLRLDEADPLDLLCNLPTRAVPQLYRHDSHWRGHVSIENATERANQQHSLACVCGKFSGGDGGGGVAVSRWCCVCVCVTYMGSDTLICCHGSGLGLRLRYIP